MTLRVAFFGAGGPFSSLALEEVRKVANVVAIVVPARRTLIARLLFDRRPPSLQAPGAETIRFRSSAQAARPLRRAGIDLIVVASFPYRLKKDVRDAARFGAINVHSSLLPRHRGPDPIFWTYFHDDRETGVTVHRLDEGMDTGAILAQKRIEVPRGMSGFELYMTLGRAGASLLRDTVVEIEAGRVVEKPQRDADVTADPAPRDDNWRIDYDTWTAERLHHFLSGVSLRPNIAIRDRAGSVFRLGRVLRWTTGKRGVPGVVERAGKLLTIACADGVVECSE